MKRFECLEWPVEQTRWVKRDRLLIIPSRSLFQKFIRYAASHQSSFTLASKMVYNMFQLVLPLPFSPVLMKEDVFNWRIFMSTYNIWELLC